MNSAPMRLTLPETGYVDVAALGQRLHELRRDGLDRLPLPGSGQTRQRFAALAEVGGHDLGLCKLFEGHTDALAIMAELGAPVAEGDRESTWATWASEPPTARLEVRTEGGRDVLSGRKAWCSGAATVSHALVSAWDSQGRQQLVAVDLRQPGISVVDEGWVAVGMAATQSVTVLFDQASGHTVGGPDAYIDRPGFWQGAVGIAACWFGAARTLGEALRRHCERHAEPHALAHLGAVDAALYSSASVLHQAAAQIDEQPLADCQLLARRVRASVEQACAEVLSHTGRALGAGPFCQNRQFARLMADLPVFIRQSHAERDLAALGQLCTPETRMWPL